MNGAFPLFACMGSLPRGSLESRLDSNWWKYLFSCTYDNTSLYLKTDGDVVEDSSITRTEVDVFVKAGKIQPENRILDLCCGQGRHSLELASRGYSHIEGLDFSQLLIDTAISRAKEAGLDKRAHFQQGNATHLPFPTHSFDVVMCLGNSFGYFHSITDDLLVLQEIARVLKPGGRLVLDLADGDYLRDNFAPRSWEWVDSTMFVCREREMAKDGMRLISREVISLTDKGVIKDQIYSERLFNLPSITALLAKVGIPEVVQFQQLESDSKRDQDLGMMAQRLVIVATAAKLTLPTLNNQSGSSEGEGTSDDVSDLPPVSPKPPVWPCELVDLANGAGRGLQATRDLNAGELVEQFFGPIMKFAEVPENEQRFVMWVGPDKWLIPEGNSRFINHSCDPNCGLTTKREIITRRPVKKGDSLCISYNMSLEDGGWHPMWTFQCNCNDYNCQRIVDRYVDYNRRPFTPRHLVPPLPK